MHRLLRLAALLGIVGACRRPELVAGVSDSAFVRAMSDLRRLPPAPALDPQARNRARDSILRANGLTAAQLEAATLALAEDPVRASAIFRAIESRAAAPHPDRVIPRDAKKDSVIK